MEFVDPRSQTMEPPWSTSGNGLLAQEMPTSFMQPGTRGRDIILISSERCTQLTDERVSAEILAEQTEQRRSDLGSWGHEPGEEAKEAGRR